MTAKYTFAAFECSPEIRQMGEALVANVESGNWRQHELFLRIVERFDDELTDAFVFKAVEAMGLGEKTRSVARSAVSTLKNTSQKLARQIAPKFDEAIMRRVADHIKVVTVWLPAEPRPRHFIGVRASQEVTTLRISVVGRIRAGEGKDVHADLTRLLNAVVDMLLEEFYMNQIRLMDLGFVSRKLIDGGVSIGRGVQHQLLKWMIPTLDDTALRNMADYMEALTLELDTLQPYRFLYHRQEAAVVPIRAT